ncbi:hypothetical protein COCVIDRAFT_103549 [Bipolaris victoriae FI3]|uniref:Uncharacterized protein n=1 Tax=Bipolaris victoriae (strain FI3) TaxID=930091 RepID=W7EI11_BIPV3|nr:hypothetical protein COCVIDRAFT_103549 [Bipolaris victoriae FI3]
MEPSELAMQAASVDLSSTSWLDSSILVEKVNNLKEISLGNCRLLYGSERGKFYDIVIGEDEETKSFGAVLTCNQDSQTKLLRTSTSTCPVKAVRKLVSDLQKDTAKLFLKYGVGSQLDGQQGYTDRDTGEFQLWGTAYDKRTNGPDDDTMGLLRSWSGASGVPWRDSRFPRNGGASGYDRSGYERRATEQMPRSADILNYYDEL